MSTLSKLLAAEEPLFDVSLKQLEARTGRAGIDAKLTAEIDETVSNRIKQLDLDSPTLDELYTALIKQVAEHDKQLAEKLGGSDPNSFYHMIPLIVKKVKELNIPKDGFFLKADLANKFLKNLPPNQIIKRLGYNDVTELLANEDIFGIFGALRFTENAQWLNSFIDQYQSLTANDFEKRPIRILEFKREKWGDVADNFIKKKLHNVTHLKEMGIIVLMPVSDIFMPGVTLKILPLILHYINEIRLYSAFFKLIRAKQNFGEILVKALIADTPKVNISEGNYIHWRVIQRYFGKLPHENHPEIFEPHLQPEDLHWRKVEQVLYDIDPQLKFWQNLDYVAASEEQEIVSFNLMDVALSYANQLKYSDRYIYHFRESLWNEIFARYLGEQTLQDQILLHLDNEIIKPEKLSVK